MLLLFTAVVDDEHPVMGNLLKLLTKEENDGCGSKIDIFLDFENATPTESEKEVFDVVHSVLDVAPQILQELQGYPGAGEEIRQAISNALNEELQEVAWRAVVPLVGKLKTFYEFALELEAVLPQLLYALCSGPETPIEHLERQQKSISTKAKNETVFEWLRTLCHQALAKQFAEILHFTLKFDDLKMTNPAIQNDFSYYRRTLSRRKMANADDDNEGVQVTNEMANRMSLFYAYPTPLLKILSDATSKFVTENKSLPIENTTDCLSTLANLCRTMIENPDFSARVANQETYLFCLRVMVGLIILYDHVHPVGAFAKTSNIDIKASIKVLKDQPQGTVDGLLNALSVIKPTGIEILENFNFGKQPWCNTKCSELTYLEICERSKGSRNWILGAEHRNSFESSRLYVVKKVLLRNCS
ncbi:Protein FAM49B [Stylophora pistillata]|uniref:Protein FAM49B n=1 Tax=Stylophora pistillata TaxID=50429 RepID=A0A2B4S454_STYPI|nr:Protein FAM49B [Stylophora pistillata]